MTLKLYAVLFLGLFSMGAKCQEVALKSNLLYDAFATLNAGVETGLADNGRSTYLPTTTDGHSRTTGSGNIGFCNLKHAIGFATDGQDTSLEHTCSEVNTTLAG